VVAGIEGVIEPVDRDPIVWQLTAAARERIGSTQGNPIFLAGFMIMVIPLTLARTVEQCGALFGPRSPDIPSQRALPRALLVIAYLLLLALQLMTIVYSQSRGPLIGLAAGLALFGFVYCGVYRTRWMLPAIVGGVAVGLALLMVSGLAGGRLARLGGIRSQLDKGTGQVRALIWQGAVDLLASQPPRMIIGYGPDV